jgi:hypothetical protein
MMVGRQIVKKDGALRRGWALPVPHQTDKNG